MPPSDWPSVPASWVVLAGSSSASRMAAREPPRSRCSAVPGPGPARLFPQRGDPAGRVDQGRRPRRVEAQREPRPAEDRGDEQQAAPAEVGFVLGGPAAQLDPALAPAQVGVQVGQRGGPALRGELPGAVHHVTFQDGAQRPPFRLEQRPPGGGQHVGDVPGHPVAGQDALDAGIDPRLPAERHRDLALRLVRGCRPDLVEQVADGGVHARRDGSQEVGAPAGRVQRVDHAEVRLAGQRPVPVAGAEQPRAEHRPVPLARLAGQQAQRLGQLPQRRQREPAHGQVLVAHLDPQYHSAPAFVLRRKSTPGGATARTMAFMTATTPAAARPEPPPGPHHVPLGVRGRRVPGAVRRDDHVRARLPVRAPRPVGADLRPRPGRRS